MLADAGCESAAAGHAALDAVAAAGAISPLVRIVSTSQDGSLRCQAACILSDLADDPAHGGAIAAAGGLQALVRSDSEEPQYHADLALCDITSAGNKAQRSRLAGAAADAGAVASAIPHLSSSDARTVLVAAQLLRCLATDSPSSPAIHSAGGIPALVRCVRRGDSGLVQEALWLLELLAENSPERCQAIAAAGGAAACLPILAHPHRTCRATAADVLILLVQNGQSAAVVTADPSGALPAALEGRLKCPCPDCLDADSRRQVTATLYSLAAARQDAASADAAAAAPAAVQAAPQSTTTATSQASAPRACAACGATHGKRLKLCTGCRTVRYCG